MIEGASAIARSSSIRVCRAADGLALVAEVIVGAAGLIGSRAIVQRGLSTPPSPTPTTTHPLWGLDGQGRPRRAPRAGRYPISKGNTA